MTEDQDFRLHIAHYSITKLVKNVEKVVLVGGWRGNLDFYEDIPFKMGPSGDNVHYSSTNEPDVL